MSDLIERIRFFVPVISVCFLLVITSIELYIKIRKKIPIRVNCWFCNVNTRVPYNQFNSWTCTSCKQYNGFDKDGDYNCDIPAQRSIQLNKRYKTGGHGEDFQYTLTPPKRNGLCETCNHNQEIKVQQLASFEPNVKENFEKEVEMFREKLEKTYELCYTCQRIVKKTLSRIMNNTLGLRLAQIEARALQLLDRHVKVEDSKKRNGLSRVCLAAMIMLSIWNLYNTSGAVNLSKDNLDSYFPPIVTHFILLAISYISAVKLLAMEYLTTISLLNIDFEWISFKTAEDIFGVNDTDFLINSAAVLLSLKSVLENDANRMSSILIMMLWNVNMLWPMVDESMTSQLFGDLVKISIAMTLFIATILKSILVQEPVPKGQQTNNSFHRIYSNCDDDLSENSDDEVNESYNSTTRSRKMKLSNLNSSFNTTKSLSPNTLKSAPWMLSENDLNRSFRSQCYQQYNQDLVKEKYCTDRLYFPSNNTLDASKRCSSMLDFGPSFRIPDDCQNRLSDLNISGASRRNNHPITCSSPTPSLISLNRCRSQVLTPARLNLVGSSQLTAPVTKTSWVAGGFFVKNNMSPKNRQTTQSDLLHPILSRRSSQSSGFESQAGSAHNENVVGSHRSSRESSIAGDVVSNFSEPAQITDWSSQINIDCGTSSIFETTLPRPQPFVPLLTDSQSIFSPQSKLESLSNCCTFPRTNHSVNNYIPSPQPVYHQFGTHRRNANKDSAFNTFSHNSWNIRAGSFVKNDFFCDK